MKRINLLLVLVLFSLLAEGAPADAVLDPGFSYHYEPASTADEYCATTDEIFITDNQKCIEAGTGSPPADQCCTPGVCGSSDTWMYYYGAKCTGRRTSDRWCSYSYDWYQSSCSASDRCEDPRQDVKNIAGSCDDNGYQSGSNNSGKILAGQCAADTCPDVGCKNGGWYKTCCKYNDVDGSGGPSIGDTLTGQVSPCSNCQTTDCCTGSGGVCVRSKGCPYGMKLTNKVAFCWYLGSTSQTGPTPTQPPPPPSPGQWVIEPCNECCLRKAWWDGPPPVPTDSCPVICGNPSYWNGAENRCVARCNTCPNQGPSSPSNIAPANGTVFDFGTDIQFSWNPPSEPRCNDPWGIVCASGYEGIPNEWCSYVLQLKYPGGNDDCPETLRDGDYCEIARQERGLDAGEDLPSQDPPNFDYQGISKKICGRDRDQCGGNCNRCDNCYACLDDKPNGPCSGGTWSCSGETGWGWFCKCVLSWYWDRNNGTSVSYDALDKEGALMFEVAPQTNRFVYSNFSPRGGTTEGRKYRISFDSRTSKDIAQGVRVVLQGRTTGESHEQTFNLGGSWVRYTTNYFSFNENQRALRIYFYGVPNQNNGDRQRVWIDNVSVVSDYIEPRTQYLLTDDLPGGTYQWRVKALVEVGDTNYSLWSYSDPYSFTIRTPTGRITGRVYESCDCAGTTSPDDQSWTVTCSGDGIDGVLDGNEASQVARQDSNSSFTCLTTGSNDQLPYGNYTISFSPSFGRTASPGCSSPQTITLDSASVTATPFYQCLPPTSSWFQVIGGNLTSHASITDWSLAILEIAPKV